MAGKNIAFIGLQFLSWRVFTEIMREVFGEVTVRTFLTVKCFDNFKEKINFDLIIFNTTFFGINLEKNILRIKELFPDARYICANHEGSHLYFCMQMVELGVDVLFSDIAGEDDYQSALMAIKTNRKYVPRKVDEAMRYKMRYMKSNRFSKLSAQEQQVLICCVNGETYKCTGEELKIKKGTVATYRKRIMDKIGGHSQRDIVRFAVEYNMLEKDDDNAN